jgi:hypothetical protein
VQSAFSGGGFRYAVLRGNNRKVSIQAFCRSIHSGFPVASPLRAYFTRRITALFGHTVLNTGFHALTLSVIVTRVNGDGVEAVTVTAPSMAGIIPKIIDNIEFNMGLYER